MVQPLQPGAPPPPAPLALAAVGGNGEAAALLPVVKHVVSEEQLELMRILGEVCIAAGAPQPWQLNCTC